LPANDEATWAAKVGTIPSRPGTDPSMAAAVPT
jgi:hypothetical protein